MNPTRTVANCRHGVLTLSLDFPRWLDAQAQPWSCQRPDDPHPLETTEVCRGCPRWEPVAGPRVVAVRP